MAPAPSGPDFDARVDAHELAERLQSIEHALARQIGESLRQSERRRAIADPQTRARQHARHRRRQQIADAHERPENARAHEQTRRQQGAQIRQPLSPVEPFVTKDDGKRKEGAARMIDGDERPLRDDIHGALRAIFRMGAPSDVGEQTGGVTQPALFLGFVDSAFVHKGVGPIDEIVAIARGARECRLQFAGRREQGIDAPLG